MVAPTTASLRAEADRVVAEINAEHHTALAVHSRCSDGMQSGAWLLVDPTGAQSILKYRAGVDVAPLRALAPKVDRLRRQGYPTPAWLAVGSAASGQAYHVQEFARGEPAYPLTAEKVGLLLDVLEVHDGLDPWPERDRSAAITSAARDESPGSLRHGVRQLGPDGVAVLEAYDDLMRSAGDVILPGGDLVHGDFNTCNILLEGGAVSAVIDIEELGSGTRVIDYACLLREAYLQEYGDEVCRRIRSSAEAIAGPAVLAVCAAAAAFFIVGFKRQHQPEELASTLVGLRRLARELAVPRHDGAH